MKKKARAKMTHRVRRSDEKTPKFDHAPWPYVEVQWHDATSESSWRSQDDLPNVSVIISRGWLVRNENDCITLAASVGVVDKKNDGDGESIDCGEIITIPRGCVHQIFELNLTQKAGRSRSKIH